MFDVYHKSAGRGTCTCTYIFLSVAMHSYILYPLPAAGLGAEEREKFLKEVRTVLYI